MPTHEDQVTDPLYWNWVKGGLGLKYITEGLESFVDETLKSVHTGFLDDIRNNTPGLQEIKCTECTTVTVLPCPTPGMCNLRKRGGICTYHDKTDTLKTSRPCPNSICDKIRVKISHQHRFSNPSWKNTNAQNWCTNHYEIGKCFLPKSGYENKTAISETDASGLLNMSINCLPIQNRLDFQITPPNDILSKILKARNDILHSASFTLAQRQLYSYIDDMVTLLEDRKTLLADPRAQTAVLKLAQLKNGTFHISPKNELDIRNEALRAVEEKKEKAIQAIQDKQEEVIDLIQETHEVKRKKMSEEITAHTETMASQCEALRLSIQTLKSTQETQVRNIEIHELRLNAIDQTLTQLKKSQDLTEEKFTILLKDFSEFKDAMKGANTMEQQHKDRIEYLKIYFRRKQELQTKLCEMYKSHIDSIPLSPVLNGLDASVDDLFVELVICDDKTHEPKYDCKKVEGYKDIFVRTTSTCKNKFKHVFKCDCEKEERVCKCKNMYVIGDAGMGKTTWCMKMLSTWVDALMTVDEATDGQGKLSDENIMSEIDILFFVSLRHAVNDGAIIDMVTHQLFEEFPEMDSIARDVLRRESQNCLIILDGLDEWRPPMDFKPRSSLQHPGLPGRQDIRGCPILTTTRPWKLDKVRLSDTDIDRAVKIQGLTNQSSLIENIICHLNDKAVSGDDHINKNLHEFYQAFKRAFKSRFDDWQTTPQKQLDRIHYNDLHSFFQIPLLLVFMVCLWYDEGKFEKTWAANFTGLIEFLIRIAEIPSYERRPGRLSVKSNLEELKAKWSLSSRYLPDSLRQIKRLTNYSELLLKLSKLAFGSLFNDGKESTLVFTEESLENEFSSDELDVALKIGLISQSKVVGKTLKRLTSMSFLHKSLQELFAALFLVWNTETDDNTALNQYSHYCRTSADINEMENILLFVCGLSPTTASEMSRHVANVTQYDRDNLLDLKTKCVLEMQAAHGSSFPSEECPIFTYGMDCDARQVGYIILKLAETNKKNLVSLHLKGTHIPVFLSDMTQLQELTLDNVTWSVQQYNTLDLTQLRELQTIHLHDLDWKCIVILYAWKLQNILMFKCGSIEIKTRSNCGVVKETMSKENSDTACKIKNISLTHCEDCKMSIEGEICTIDNVSIWSCKSCQFTMQACKETHWAGNMSTRQRSNIHSLVIHGSINLTLDINNEVEVTGVKIRDYKCPITKMAYIDTLIQQLPGFKQIDIKDCRFTDYSPFMLPNEVEDIAIPIEWIKKIRHLSNIVHLRLFNSRSDRFGLREPKPNNLTDILPSLTKLKSIEIDDTVTTTVLNILTNICIERLGLYVYVGFKEISRYLPRIQNLKYLKLTDLFISSCRLLGHMLLHMPQLKTLSIGLVGDTCYTYDRNADHVQHSDSNVKKLQLEKFSIDFGDQLSAIQLPKTLINYLKHCCRLKDLRCSLHVLEQLVSEPELKQILTQVETFKSKAEICKVVSFGVINKLSKVRHGDLRSTVIDDFVKVIGVFVNLEHIETLKLECKGRYSSGIVTSRQFVDSLPVTRQPITIEISGCRLNYDVEQYLRSQQWLQSVERTVTYNKNAIRVPHIKILILKKIN